MSDTVQISPSSIKLSGESNALQWLDIGEKTLRAMYVHNYANVFSVIEDRVMRASTAGASMTTDWSKTRKIVQGKRIVNDDDYEKLNNLGLAWLSSNIDTSVRLELNGINDIRDAWTKLKTTYLPKTEQNKALLYMKLSVFKQANLSVTDYLLQMKSLQDQYNAACGEKRVDDTQLYTFIRMGVADRYKHTLETLKISGRLTFDDVKAAMLDVELTDKLIEAHTLTQKALFAKDTKQKRQRKDKSKQHNKRKPGDKYPLCKHCGRTNVVHSPADCYCNPDSAKYRPTWTKASEKRKQPDSTRTTEHDHQLKRVADSANTSTAMLIAQVIDPNTEHEPMLALKATHVGGSNSDLYNIQFYLDSGASIHLTGDIGLLHNVKQTKAVKVHGIGSTAHIATRSGELHLQYTHDGKPHAAIVHNVYHISGMEYNLLSVGALTDKKAVVVFNNNKADVQLGDHTVITAYRQRSLYETTLLVRCTDKAYLMTAHGLYDGMTEHHYGFMAEAAVDVEIGDDQSEPHNIDTTTSSGRIAASTQTIDVNDSTTVARNMNWHRRLDHISETAWRAMSRAGAVPDMPIFSGSMPACEDCIYGKQQANAHIKQRERSTNILQLIHSDVCTMPVFSALEKHKYFVTFIDDYSRLLWVTTVQDTANMAQVFSNFILYIESQSRPHKILAIMTDNGPEYTNYAMQELLQRQGIRHDYSAPYASEQNGVAERINRTMLDAIRTKLHHANQPHELWPQALKAAAYVYNRKGCAPNNGLTPYEMWCGAKPSVAHLRVWGCEAYVKNNNSANKLAVRSQPYTFIGYCDATNNYILLEQKMRPGDSRHYTVKSNDVIFHERVFTRTQVIEASTAETFVHKRRREEAVNAQPRKQPASVGEKPQADAVEEATASDNSIQPPADSTTTVTQAENAPATLPSEPATHQRRSIRLATQHTPRAQQPVVNAIQQATEAVPVLSAMVVNSEPTTYKQAITCKNHAEWQQAMRTEWQSLNQHKTGTLVKRPAGHNVLKCRWVYRIKRDHNNKPVKYKARLVVKGFMQRYGVDFFETYAPTVRMQSILILMAIVARHNLELHQLDVDTAFLYGKLDEEVYMEQPEGFVDQQRHDHVWRLNKSLYGLKQAPKVWYDQVNAYFTTQLHFKRVATEFGLYVYHYQGTYCIISLYVDDMLIGCNSKQFLAYIKQQISKQWSIKDIGEAKHVLGLTITRNRAQRKLFVNQGTYIKSILKQYNMTDCTPADTPCHTERLVKSDAPPLPNIPYREATGSLIYVCYTRPDICYAVTQVCKHNNNYNTTHWTAVKRILRYLKGTIDYKLTFDGTAPLTLEGYSDADFAADTDSRRSYSGYTMFLGKSLISWSCAQQSVTAYSTVESEYMALSHAHKEVAYLRATLADLSLAQPKATTIHGDNQGAIARCYNPTHHKLTKHIDIRYHRIRDEINNGSITVQYINTVDMRADIMTKALTPIKHQAAVRMLNIYTA